MKRKIAALLMASALTAALITACGSGDEETSGESAEETTAEETSGEESEEASDGYVSAEDAVAAKAGDTCAGCQRMGKLCRRQSGEF